MDSRRIVEAGRHDAHHHPVDAVERNHPPENLFIALTRLGFHGQVKSPDSDGVTGILLITAEKDSVAVKWRPSGKYPCVAVPRSRMASLVIGTAQETASAYDGARRTERC